MRAPFKLKFSFGRQEFLETLEHLRNHPKRSPLEVSHVQLQKIAAKKACSNSYKVQDVMDASTMNSLIQAMSGIASPYTCPHGRPTVFELSSISKLTQTVSQPNTYML